MKHLFQLSLLLLALLLPATALAHDFEVDGIYYNINGNEATVTYKGADWNTYSDEYSGEVTIPATVTYGGTTYTVTSIGGHAFCRCTGLTNIIIPNTVISIGNSAFSSCSGLTGVTIPNSVTTIGEAAFSGCSSLTSIDIPNSVTAIGGYAFAGTPWYNNQSDGLVYAGLVAYKYNGTMSSGTSITLRDGTLGIAGSAFYGCTGLTSIDIPNSVTSIGALAFSDCIGLTSIDIPNSVTSIAEGTFWGCSALTSVTIGNSVNSIGRAFSGCSALTNMIVAEGNTTYDSRNNCNAIIETASNTLITGCKNTVIPNSVTTIGDDAFRGCTGLTSVTIPNSVTSIGNYAFSDCSSLTSITIPYSVTSIGNHAFYGCSGLTSIDIPNSVTSIGEDVFNWCGSLTSVTIGNSVTSIGNYAFYHCSGLSEIYSLALTPPTIDSYTFYDCYGATLFVPEDAYEAYKQAEFWKNFNCIVCIGAVTPGTIFVVDGIYYSALNASMASVIANEEVENYYTGDVVIPDSVTYEDYTFAVTGIESNAFEDCYELSSVVISNSVIAIGEQAFQGCTGLTSVTIGSGVTGISAKAFNYCNALETVKCLGTVPPVMASADCFSTAAYNRATLHVPRNSEATYAVTDYWYKFAHIDGWGSAGRGDVNGDGVMSIRDVTSLIDVLLGNELDSFYFDSADLNSNGRIDIGDVTTLIDNLLNGDY